ncbi:hypothetical protein QBC45DRAFT_176280 [Copromyces sp. CBS 386.78]|nr:hypothetical protein QBC45DRAFT_176280 [Copromyces sp. CBS 386.78]
MSWNEQMARPAQFTTYFGHFDASKIQTIVQPKDQITSKPHHTAGLSAGPGFHFVAQALSSVHDSAQPPLREVGTGFSHWSRPATPSATPLVLLTKFCPVRFRDAEGQKVSMGCLRSGDPAQPETVDCKPPGETRERPISGGLPA